MFSQIYWFCKKRLILYIQTGLTWNSLACTFELIQLFVWQKYWLFCVRFSVKKLSKNLTSSSNWSKKVIFWEKVWSIKLCFCCCFKNRVSSAYSAEQGLSFKYTFSKKFIFTAAVSKIFYKKVAKKHDFGQKDPCFCKIQ